MHRPHIPTVNRGPRGHYRAFARVRRYNLSAGRKRLKSNHYYTDLVVGEHEPAISGALNIRTNQRLLEMRYTLAGLDEDVGLQPFLDRF